MRSQSDGRLVTRGVSGATQADLAYEHLRDGIVGGRLKPGSPIRITEVAKDLNISLGAVREALAQLAAQDLAVSVAQKGYTVPKISVEDLRDLTDCRITIERHCLRDSIANGDIEWETELVARFHRLQRLPEREPSGPARLSDAWSAAHEQFHAALVAGCKSPWMLKIRAMLFMQAERYRRLSVPLRKIGRDVAAEHKAIFDAAMNRDADRGAELMRAHLRLTTEILVEFAAAPENAAATAPPAP